MVYIRIEERGLGRRARQRQANLRPVRSEHMRRSGAAVFAIDMPTVELTFPIVLKERAGTSRAIVLPVLQEILTNVLDINASRLDVDVTGAGVIANRLVLVCNGLHTTQSHPFLTPPSVPSFPSTKRRSFNPNQSSTQP